MLRQAFRRFLGLKVPLVQETVVRLLCLSQYGFRQAHSTQHAILDMVETIQTNMDKKLFSCGVFIDLKNVFDIES